MSTVKANFFLDSAGGNTAQINGITPALSSQAQAEAGTDNTTLMTPLRVTNALNSLNTVLLGTLVTTSGASQTLSGLNLTSYKFLKLFVNAVSATAAFNLTLDGIIAGQSSGAAANVVDGVIDIDLATGVFNGSVGVMANNAFIYAGRCSYRTSSTSITLGTNSGTFDAGSIAVYGIR